jgi:glutaredoxin
MYIPEACPFCRRVREALTELDLSAEVLLHHIIHYKPI